MKVTTIFKPGALKTLEIAQRDALSQTASEVLSRTIDAAVIPFDIGTMQNESTFVQEKQLRQGLVSIVTDTPYALRMYMHPEYKFQTVNNANARGEWWEPYLRGALKNDPTKIFMELVKRNARRYIK